MQKITGNEPYNRIDAVEEIIMGSNTLLQIRPATGGLTIYQELSARFMVALIKSDPNPHNLHSNAEDACNYAYALINEWNNRM